MAMSPQDLYSVTNLKYLNVLMELSLRRCYITMAAALSMSVNVSLYHTHGHFINMKYLYQVNVINIKKIVLASALRLLLV